MVPYTVTGYAKSLRRRYKQLCATPSTISLQQGCFWYNSTKANKFSLAPWRTISLTSVNLVLINSIKKKLTPLKILCNYCVDCKNGALAMPYHDRSGRKYGSRVGGWDQVWVGLQVRVLVCSPAEEADFA